MIRRVTNSLIKNLRKGLDNLLEANFELDKIRTFGIHKIALSQDYATQILRIDLRHSKRSYF